MAEAMPMDVAKVQEVIVTTIKRRGEGRSEDDPVRIVKQFWSRAGELLAESDPWADVNESLQVHDLKERIKKVADLRDGMRQRIQDLMEANTDLEKELAEAKRIIAANDRRREPGAESVAAMLEVLDEAHKAYGIHGPLRSAHEGWGVLREEVRELEEVFMLKDRLRDAEAGRLEAKQVAAVALRIMLDVFPIEKKEPQPFPACASCKKNHDPVHCCC